MTALLLELRQNFRLRIGLWLIIGLFLSYAVIFLNTYQGKIKKDYQEALHRLHQLRTIAKQTQWPQRATQIHQLLQQLEARLWQAETKGLAQAMFQSWLQEEMYFAQFENPRLDMQAPLEVPNYPQIWQVTADLNAGISPIKLHQFLSGLLQNPQLVAIEKLDIRFSRVNLTISAYFLKPKEKK